MLVSCIHKIKSVKLVDKKGIKLFA